MSLILIPDTLEMLSKRQCVSYSHKVIMDFRILTGNANKKNAISATISNEQGATRNGEYVTENIVGSVILLQFFQSYLHNYTLHTCTHWACANQQILGECSCGASVSKPYTAALNCCVAKALPSLT